MIRLGLTTGARDRVDGQGEGSRNRRSTAESLTRSIDAGDERISAATVRAVAEARYGGT